MPTVDTKPIGEGGWGCSCADHRRQKVDKTLFPSLVKAANVKVEVVRREADGTIDYVAWTNPNSPYQVVYSPKESGGWCKHALACLASREPFLQRTIQQVKEEVESWQVEQKILSKENKRLVKELIKLSRD